MEQIKVKHKKLDDFVESINISTKEFNTTTFFLSFKKDVSFTSYEVCFKDTVSWLYILLIEATELNLKFVLTKVKDLGIQSTNESMDAPKLIHALRTSRQHLMSSINVEDNDKLSYCVEWYKQHCASDTPESEDDWKNCLNVLLDIILSLLQTVDNCIKEFRNNEFADIIKNDWDRLVNRSFTKHDWELVLIEVLKDYGMSHYDTLAIVTKELNKWREKLKILKDGFIFNIEARRIIEGYLQTQDLWPANANDLITLGVPRGPGLGEMVKKAKELYYYNPCSKEELLTRFKERYI